MRYSSGKSIIAKISVLPGKKIVIRYKLLSFFDSDSFGMLDFFAVAKFISLGNKPDAFRYIIVKNDGSFPSYYPIFPVPAAFRHRVFSGNL